MGTWLTTIAEHALEENKGVPTEYARIFGRNEIGKMPACPPLGTKSRMRVSDIYEIRKPEPTVSRYVTFPVPNHSASVAARRIAGQNPSQTFIPIASNAMVQLDVNQDERCLSRTLVKPLHVSSKRAQDSQQLGLIVGLQGSSKMTGSQKETITAATSSCVVDPSPLRAMQEMVTSIDQPVGPNVVTEVVAPSGNNVLRPKGDSTKTPSSAF